MMKYALVAVLLFITLVEFSISIQHEKPLFPKGEVEKELQKLIERKYSKPSNQYLRERYNDHLKSFHGLTRKQVGRVLHGYRQTQQHTPAGMKKNGYTMTPLDDYVSKPDPNYKWTEYSEYHDEVLFDVHFLNVTSQKWLNESIVSRSIWWHTVAVIRPLDYDVKDRAIMYVTGGSNPGPGSLPELTSEDLLLATFLAIEAGSISVVLWHIPNEHILFYDEKPTPISRGEDAIIAYTWKHFLENPNDPEWVLRLPMTKGVIKTMDAVEEYVEKKFGNKISRWVVAGASKRGWTTFTAGAYDVAHEQRMDGIVPMVMSFINFHSIIHQWWQSMGGWSWALKDYYDLNITASFDSPKLQLLADIVDPYTYMDRYQSIPILQVMSSDDEFFQIRDTYNYWDKLQKDFHHLIICENSEHALFSSLLDLLPTITSFYRSFIESAQVPSLTWKLDYSTNTIHMQSTVKPSVVKVWFAHTPSVKRIDFRWLIKKVEGAICPYYMKDKDICLVPIVWFDQEPTKIDDLNYSATINVPGSGYTAFFIQAQFADSGAGTEYMPHVFTSEAMVLPNRQPFPDCHGADCKGELV